MCVALIVAASVVGCAKPPQAEIDSAKQALSTASASQDVKTYAPESLASAREAASAMEAELTVQEEKFALTRKYDKAKQLAADAKTAADRAVSDAASAKERARNEASQLIASVRQALTDVRGMLDSMPKGKGTAADIAAIRADVDGAESQLMQADSTFASGDFLDAKAQAEAVMATVQRTKADIEQAIELSKSKR
jgi:hypothetical protein